MPPGLRQKINEDVTRIVAEPATRASIEDLGGDAVNEGPKEFSAFIDSEQALGRSGESLGRAGRLIRYSAGIACNGRCLAPSVARRRRKGPGGRRLRVTPIVSGCPAASRRSPCPDTSPFFAVSVR
jgi:hypothetical protein